MAKKCWTLVTVVLALALGGAAGYIFWSAPVALPTPGTRRMAERLERVASAWEQAEYVEDEGRLFRANQPAWIPILRGRIEGNQDPREVLLLRYKLARELLWDGQILEALPEFERIYRMLVQSNLPAEDRDRLTARVLHNVTITFLRMAEEENCLRSHNADSCIFPIRGGGVHTKPDGARRAIEVLTESLNVRPDDAGSRWLLNLACMVLGEYPGSVPPPWLIPPETFASDADFPRYRDVAGELGVDTVGLAGGCCVDDFDRDGDLDIIASSWGLRDPLRYFRQGDDGTFEERTAEAGLRGEVGALNICHTDFDNDGALDVFVLRGGWLGENGRHPNSLLRNLGNGTFDDVTEEAGLLSYRPSQTASWGDFDNDGWVDVFVGNEQERAGEHSSQLFRNNGDGTFTDCAAASGLAELGFVKGAAWGDYDNDGHIDLYVSRIGQPNLLFRNGGRKKPGEEGDASDPRVVAWEFTDVTSAAGVAEPRFSFPAWFWDYDNDGWLDIFVAGYDGASIGDVAGDYLGSPHRRGHPRLYRNLGDGTFRDVTREAKLDRVLLAMGANFGDVDGDGFLDVYVGTGAPDLSTLMPNRMFRNAGGKVFQDVTTAGGFGHLQKGHGVAFVDIDGDGDQDVFAVMGGWYTSDVFQNVLFQNPGHGNHWLTLRLRGVRAHRAAFGARIRVTVRTPGGSREIHSTVGTGGSFGSASLDSEIGLGDAVAVERVEIRWPGSGAVQVLEQVEMDRVLEVTEEAGA